MPHHTPAPAPPRQELRELVERMLTLDWQKRPSINDVLAAPVMKARIQRFLSATLHVSAVMLVLLHRVAGFDVSGEKAGCFRQAGIQAGQGRDGRDGRANQRWRCCRRLAASGTACMHVWPGVDDGVD